MHGTFKIDLGMRIGSLWSIWDGLQLSICGSISLQSMKRLRKRMEKRKARKRKRKRSKKSSISKNDHFINTPSLPIVNP